MSYAATVLGTSGLVSFWKCGEASGTTASDYKGVNTGTYHGTYTLGGPGRLADYGDIGYAAKLEAAGSAYLEIPDAANLQLGDTFTIEFILSRLASSGATEALVYKAGHFDLTLASGLLELTKPGTGLTSRSDAGTTILDLNPHHVVVSKNGAGATVKMYIDGVDVTGTVNAHTYTNSANPIQWGYNGSVYGPKWLQYLAVYNTVLSGATVLAHYEAGLTFGPHPDEVPMTTRDIFPTTSFINTPVEIGVTHEISADSADLVTELVRQATDYTPGFNTVEFTTPIITVDGTVPDVEVIVDHTGTDIDAFMAAVPIPDDTSPSPSSDGQLTIWKPSTYELWEFFQMGKSLFPPSGGELTVAQTGGSLAAATYYYNITCYNANGETLSKERSGTISTATGLITYDWDENPSADGYRIYRSSTSGIGTLLADVSNPTTTYVDDGSVTPSGASIPFENTAVHIDGNWHCSWGGYIPDTRESPGYFTDPPFSGCAASSIALTAGTVTVHELETLAAISHGLAFALKDVDREPSGIPAGDPRYLWPAQRSDGIYDSSPAIRQGQMFVLDPAFDIDAHDFDSTSAVPEMLARALQTYGMVCRDRAGNLALYGEDPRNFGRVNPYKALYNGDYANVFLDPVRFPWDQMIAVDAQRNYFGPTTTINNVFFANGVIAKVAA